MKSRLEVTLWLAAASRRPAARSSQRAWREELLDAEGSIEGATSEPLLSELPVLGRGQRSGRAETRHGHVHAHLGLCQDFAKFDQKTKFAHPHVSANFREMCLLYEDSR